MAEVKPLRALHYDPESVGSFEAVIAPPYDVIDAELRAQLLGQSPKNVVEIDLPESPDGGDIYEHAAETLERWRADGTVVQDDEPAYWVLEQDYTAPDGSQRRRRGFFARVRVEDYGPGRIRPHERTHPGPKEDRLRLTRATKANLSPIFSLFPDPGDRAGKVMEDVVAGEPFARAADHEGTQNAMWRVSDPDAVAELESALAEAELLIADGHHRYETARVYADEIGGEGDHRYVLMYLVSLSDPGLLVFPTHRLLTGLKDDALKQEAIRDTLTQDFDLEEIPAEQLEPEPGDDARADGLHGLVPQAGVRAGAEGPVDRRRGAGRQARPLPAAGHGGAGGAGAQGRAGHDRGRHLAPERAWATPRTSPTRATRWSRAAPTRASSCARPRSSRCARSRRRASRCRRSRPTSIPRCPPAYCSTRL